MAQRMQFGSGVGKDKTPYIPQIKWVAGGLLTDSDVTETLTFEPGGFYLLFCKEWTASTDAFRGLRITAIGAPEEEIFGTVAIAHGAVYSSSNSGVTYTYPTDSTMQIKLSAATYNARYALYQVQM